MDRVLTFLNSYRGRDKILRLLCYSSKFIAGCLEPNEIASQFDRFSSQLSTSRACFRLLDDIPTIVDVMSQIFKEKDKENFMDRAIRILENFVEIIFCPLDHISWAIDHKILKFEDSRWDTASTFCWVISLYISIFKIIKNIVAISKQKIQLRKNSSERENFMKLSAQQQNLQISALKLFLDLLFAVNYLPRGMLWAKFFSKQHVGTLGTLSSLISLYLALST